MPLTPPAPILDPRLGALLARRMNCDLFLQEAVLVDDGSGGKTKTWPASGAGIETLGAIEGLSGQEKLAEGGADSAVTHRILIPYQAGVKPTMRVAYGGRRFDVHSVIDYSEQHLILELMVEERFVG